ALPILFPGDVGSHYKRIAGQRIRQGLELVLRARGQQQPGPQRCELLRQGQPDAARRTGEENGPTLQVTRHRMHSATNSSQSSSFTKIAQLLKGKRNPPPEDEGGTPANPPQSECSIRTWEL